MEKVSTDGHIGQDTHLCCAVPYRENGKTIGENVLEFPSYLYVLYDLTLLIAFRFTLELYSEPGNFGVDHRAKYKPSMSNPPHPGRLEKFDHELTLAADQIQSLLVELARQFGLL